MDREFLYVARGVQPSDAERVKALDMPGVNLTREYRRYYPAGEVTGHCSASPASTMPARKARSWRSITGSRARTAPSA